MTYLDDDEIVLSKGSIDLVGARTYCKPANVPDEYVVALQKDLTTLGFALGAADGFFGNRTNDALKAFQAAALSRSRVVNGIPVSVTPSYQGEPHGECDEETRQEIKLWLQMAYRQQGLSVPIWIGPEEPQQENDIPFATSEAVDQYWPILTQERGGREVAYRGTSGEIYGRPGRRFLADRANGRYHVGVDLWAEAGDIIVACEDGIIVNYYHFYDNVDALFEQCDSGVVINYGEVKPGSWQEFGLKKNSRVKAGQPIARVGQMTNSAMCHFEMYRKGATHNHRYYKDKIPPAALLNPTKYLLNLAANGLSQVGQQPRPPLPEFAPTPDSPDFSGLGLVMLHNAFPNGIRWRLTPQGIEVEGSGIERSPGAPITVTKIWDTYGDQINHWASHYNVPCVLIVATIATESSGHADVIRKEPGYISDTATPHKISVGLMQTLISTASSSLNNPAINRAWLLNPDNSIQAGTSYINEQRSKTLLDPPKVACAYNAGSIKENTGTNNRWKMRQYPIGTSAHCDRFVKWFNDAVAVLETHSKEPSIPYDVYFS